MEILKKKLNTKYAKLNTVLLTLGISSIVYTALFDKTCNRLCVTICMICNTLIMLSNAMFHKSEGRKKDTIICIVSAFVILCSAIFIYFN